MDLVFSSDIDLLYQAREVVFEILLINWLNDYLIIGRRKTIIQMHELKVIYKGSRESACLHLSFNPKCNAQVYNPSVKFARLAV